MKYRVLVTDKLEKNGINVLKKYSEIEVVEKDTMSPDELKKEINNYDGIIVRSATKLTKDILENSQRLKVISRAGVGVDNIDLPTATEKGIVVMNAPSGNTISTAEHTFALMISLARQIPAGFISLYHEGKWDRKSYKGVELFGKTLGIIGMGRIGTEVAKRAKAFGMNILGFDPYLSDERAREIGVEMSSLERIYKESDFITIHTPLTDQTKGMIGKKELAMMKPTCRIINAARGGIIDEEALAEALKAGTIAGAAVDVFSKEPPFEPRNPLLDAPNIITVPHLGASTSEAQSNVALESAESIANFLVNGVIVNSLNMPSIDKEHYQEIKGYIDLSESMSNLISQVVEGQVSEIVLGYEGDIVKNDVSLITRAALRGLFEPFMGNAVNYVNAVLVARSRGIKVVEQKEIFPHTDYPNLISMQVKTDKETMELWGTIFSQNNAKIVRFNEYDLELSPSGIVLVIYNEDKPGVVGQLGTILGNNNINIAGLVLARNPKTRTALTLVKVDSEVNEDIKQQLNQISGVQILRVVKFRNSL